MSAIATIPAERLVRSRLRKVDLDFFAEGGVSPFALLGYSAAPMRTQAVDCTLDVGFTVRRARVRFLRSHRFVLASECRGEPDDTVPAYLIPVIERFTIVDTVAWHPRTGRLATEHRRAGLLGADTLDEGEAVSVLPDPRSWLADWRRGLCVVDEALARPVLLGAGVRLIAADVAHGEALDGMLRKVRVPQIMVPETSSVRAAA